MGQTTPNIGIYIPAAGETNYDQSFAAGMINIDQHDHSGGPNKGLPIATEGLADFSVTFDKLNANVVDPTTGIGTSATFPNKLVILDLLKNIFQLSATAGFISKDGILAHARTFINSATISFANGDGVGGDPSASLIAPVTVPNGGTGIITAPVPYAPILAGTTSTAAFQQPASAGNAGEVYVSQGNAAPGAFSSLSGLGQIQYATITLTGNQIRALNTTPISFVAAPGAGKVLVPLFMYGLLTSSGNAFTGGFPATSVTLAYNTTNAVMNFSSNAFVTVTADYYSWATQNTLATIGGVAKAGVQNQPLTLTNPGAAYSNGTTSTITINLAYVTITL